MSSLLEKIDKTLTSLAWSLWSELGVAGIERQHKNCLISPEELIILTALVAESDPRLRDEALDWCSKYHYFISVSRLRTLVGELGEQVFESFSRFAATLNSIAQTKWPVFVNSSFLHVVLSGKSILPSCEAPALLVLRLRALFGVGIKADLLTFCLTQEPKTFTAIDTVKIGYNKRSLAEALESFVQSGLMTSSMIGNRREYKLTKQDELQALLGNLPKIAPDWQSILEVCITLRTNLQRHQNFSTSSKVIVSRNSLEHLKNYLRALNLSPPLIYPDLDESWKSFCDWFSKTLNEIEQNNFWGNFRVKNVEITDKLIDSIMQRLYEPQDCLDGLELTMSYAVENPLKHGEVFKKNYGYAITFLRDLVKAIESLFKFPVYSFSDRMLSEILHRFQWEEFPSLQKEINKFLSAKDVTRPDIALKQYQILEASLNKFHSFMYRFSERLKKLYFLHTDMHLLTLSKELVRRHLILKLFHDKEKCD